LTTPRPGVNRLSLHASADVTDIQDPVHSPEMIAGAVNAFTHGIDAFTLGIDAFTHGKDAFTHGIYAFTHSNEAFTQGLDAFTNGRKRQKLEIAQPLDRGSSTKNRFEMSRCFWNDVRPI